jgi:Uri superfamily endonuclease
LAIVPVETIPPLPGSYALCLRLDSARSLTVGRLGEMVFSPGIYIYMGSAWGPGGLKARLGRHLRGDGIPHWHVDFLRAACRVMGYGFTADGDPRQECRWSQRLGALPGASYIRGFGASDCRDCPAHLVFWGETRMETVREVLTAAAATDLVWTNQQVTA